LIVNNNYKKFKEKTTILKKTNLEYKNKLIISQTIPISTNF